MLTPPGAAGAADSGSVYRRAGVCVLRGRLLPWRETSAFASRSSSG
jgi:hypothetical protein